MVTQNVEGNPFAGLAMLRRLQALVCAMCKGGEVSDAAVEKRHACMLLCLCLSVAVWHFCCKAMQKKNVCSVCVDVCIYGFLSSIKNDQTVCLCKDSRGLPFLPGAMRVCVMPAYEAFSVTSRRSISGYLRCPL